MPIPEAASAKVHGRGPTGARLAVGITGAEGLLGWHLRAFLHGSTVPLEVRPAERATFGSSDALETFVRDLDVLVHMAGVNRGDPNDLIRINRSLAEALTFACDRAGAAPHVLFSSSTHIYRDTPYGNSKIECASHLARWTADRGASFTNLILPHVFGEFGRPFHNSVVSTFCHQLAEGETPQVKIDGELELVHAQVIAEHILRCVLERRLGDVRISGKSLRVSTLLAKLKQFESEYAAQVLPRLEQPLDLALFNTLRSFLFPKRYPVPVALREDHRGHLFEAVRTRDCGQAFVSWTRPGITRGNHYHRRKIERFLVLDGYGLIRIRKLFTNNIVEFHVNGGQPRFVDMPTFHTHSIANVGDSDMVTMFWSNEIFDPTDPDTFTEPV